VRAAARLAAAAFAAAVLAACGGGDHPGGASASPASTAPSGPETAGPDATESTDPAGAGDDGTGLDRGGSDAGSDLDRGGSDAASTVDREVSETLSELGAVTRGGDTVVTLPDRVLFAFGEHALLPEAAQTLDQLAAAITGIEDAPVRVEGHTDAVGGTASNQALSERRAQSVVAHLVGAGVDEDRLTATGWGETRPVAPNARPDGSDDPDGRAQNRRVEVIIVGVALAG
jgi:outer membrane protein OmpA-like peptidoglycan-associated protein